MRGSPWDSLPGVTPIGNRGFDWTELPAGIGLEGAEKLAAGKGGKDGVGPGTEGVATSETPRDFKKDLVNIGRRVMFGGVIGALSGAAFGSVDVVKDVKGMLASRKAAAAKVMQYSVRFATFNAAYQSLQYSLNLYSGLEPEVSFGASAVATMAPMLWSHKYRFMLPYAVCLVVIDGINAREEGRIFKSA